MIYDKIQSSRRRHVNRSLPFGYLDLKRKVGVGKDADYLVFEEDLLTRDPEGLSQVLPEEFYLEGRKVQASLEGLWKWPRNKK